MHQLYLTHTHRDCCILKFTTFSSIDTHMLIDEMGGKDWLKNKLDLDRDIRIVFKDFIRVPASS